MRTVIVLLLLFFLTSFLHADDVFTVSYWQKQKAGDYTRPLTFYTISDYAFYGSFEKRMGFAIGLSVTYNIADARINHYSTRDTVQKIFFDFAGTIVCELAWRELKKLW
ncbi:hypothetical protein EH221_07020 [bacterium]|nr:MAG: hypothetical protein EH221_07020 [bacterium]